MYNFKTTLSLALLLVGFNAKINSFSPVDSWNNLETPHQTVLSLLGTGAAAVIVNKLVENKSVRSMTDKATITSSEIKLITALEAILLTLAPMTRDKNKVGDEGFYYHAKRLPVLYVIGKLINTKMFQDVVGAIPLGLGEELRFDVKGSAEMRGDCDKSKDMMSSEGRKSADWLRMLMQTVALYVPANKFIFDRK